jgi:hypothetical protein
MCLWNLLKDAYIEMLVLTKFKEMQTNRITLLQRYLVLISSPINYTQPDNVIATLFLIKLINELQTNLTMLLWNLL